MPIHVEYKLEADEFVRGGLAAFRRTHRTIQLIGVLFGLLLAATYALNTGEHISPTDVWLTVFTATCALYLILLPSMRRLALRRQYMRLNLEGTSLTLAEDSVTWILRSAHTEHRSIVRWAHYARIRETPEFFLFSPTRKRVAVVPKRAFSQDQAASFSQFVRAHNPSSGA